MATNDISEQLNITAKLAAQVERMAAASERLERSYDSQIAAVQKLAETFNQLNAQGAAQGVDVLNRALKDVTDRMKEAGRASDSTFKTIARRLEESGKTFSQKFPKSVAIATAALAGMHQGLKNVVALGKGVASFATGFVDAATSIAASIVAIPMKMFKGLIELSHRMYNGCTALAEAMEALRKQFGAFYGPTNKAIIHTTKAMTGFSATGLSTWRVFGNMADRLNYLREMATEMGAAFNLLRKEFEENGGTVLAYRKGLGLTAEQMKAVSQRSDMMGYKSTKTLKEMTKLSYALGNAFSLDAKVISREVGEAMKDMGHFGTTSVKVLSETVTYAHRFGLELKDIAGTLDKYLSFDDAAEGAANLSQAFGVNIDSFALMKASAEGDAGKSLEVLRKSFRDAGIDATKFTAVDRKLVAQNTGLSDAAIQAAFSLKKQGLSLAEVQKVGDKAAKQTMTQEQAMLRLADAIERIVRAGHGMRGGFWDQWFGGIQTGVLYSQDFLAVMRNIQMAMRTTFMIGLKLGRDLVRLVPGLKDMFGGLRDFFSPAVFGKMFENISDAIRRFFDPRSADKDNVPKLFESLKKAVSDMFTKEGSAGKRIIEGFKQFFMMLSKTAGEIIKYTADNVAVGITYMVDLITGKETLDVSGASGAGKQGLGFLYKLIKPIGEALAHAWTVLKDPLWKMVTTLFDKLVEFLKSDAVVSKLKPAAGVLAVVLFGPAFTSAIVAAMTASIVKGASSLLLGTGRSVIQDVAEKAAAAGSASQRVAGAGKHMQGALPSASASTDMVGSAKALDKGGSSISWSSVGKFLVGFAAVVAIGMVAVFGSIIIIRKFSITGDEIKKALAIVGGAAAAMLLAAGPIALLSKVQVDFKSAALGIAAMALGIGAMVAAIGIIHGGLKLLKVSPAEMSGVAKMLTEVSKVFLVSGVIVAEAMAIGGLIMATKGLAGIAALAGFGVMAAAVAAMSTTIVAIMKSLNEMTVASGFKDKVDAFAAIMEALTNFTKNLTSIISIVTPSWITLLRGGDDTVERVKSLSQFMEAFIGRPGGAGLIGLMEKIVASVSTLGSADEKTLEAARVFGSLLGAVSSLAAALKPPDKLFESVDGFWSTSDDVKDAIDRTTRFVSNVSTQVQTLITVFKDKVWSIVGVGISDSQVKGAQALGALMAAAFSVAQALTPSPAVIDSLRDTIGNVISHDDVVVNPQNMQLLGRMVTNIGDSLQKLLPPVIAAMEPLLRAIGGWRFSDADAAAAKAIGPLLQQMLVIVQAITAQSAALATAKVPNLDVKAFIDRLGDVMPKILLSIADKVPELFRSMRSGIQSLQSGAKPEALKQGIDSFNGLMEVLKSVPELAKQLTGLGADVKGAAFDSGVESSLASTIDRFVSFFGRMTDVGLGPTVDDPPFMRLATYLTSDSIKALSGAKGGIETLRSTFAMLVEIPKMLRELASATGGSQFDEFALASAVNNVATFFWRITQAGLGDFGNVPPLQRIADSLRSPAIAALAQQGQSASQLKAATKVVSDFQENMTKLAGVLRGDQADKSGVAGALAAVSDMVKQANELDKALADGNVNKIDVKARLERVAKAVGLGGKASYTVDTGKNVVITVNMQVVMSASDVEKSIIFNKSSIIADRLNFATQRSNPPGSDTISRDVDPQFPLQPKGA